MQDRNFQAFVALKMAHIRNGVKPHDESYTECLECPLTGTLEWREEIYGESTANPRTAAIYTLAGYELARK